MKTLYGMPNTRSFRVLWILEEAGIEYDYRVVDLGKGGGQDPEFLRLNPAAKLPVLTDGDLVLTESAAICSYIATEAPAAGLIPLQDPAQRALYDQWCFFVLTELEQPLWTMGKHKFALPKDYRVPAVLPTAAFEFQRALGLLARALSERDFLVGDRFTVADLLATHTLNWARAFKIELGSERLEAVRQKHSSRPAFLSSQAIEAQRKGAMS
ncbi:MAG: glutathione S-transferase family protein [Deltaproteobacteria bacterium]|nr:glutathione S-transferase family protein [Deltaproteobacteria bacterium]NCP02750.1 glutathione S-transferase family protein [Deltaproteobacteria bacterium]